MTGGSTDVMDALARLLRAWRERALLTQQQLAEGSGLGVRTIRRLESPNAPRPRGESIKLLADTLRLNDHERAQLLAACRGEPVAAAAQSVHVPRQLPPDVAGFAGRGDHLAELDRLISDASDDGVPRRTVVAVISGMAGVESRIRKSDTLSSTPGRDQHVTQRRQPTGRRWRRASDRANRRARP